VNCGAGLPISGEGTSRGSRESPTKEGEEHGEHAERDEELHFIGRS
jgi:hypothetical protein